jgi:hypothetical protein
MFDKYFGRGGNKAMCLTDHEKDVLGLARKAVENCYNGDPVKDAIDDYEIKEALELLVKLADMEKLK